MRLTLVSFPILVFAANLFGLCQVPQPRRVCAEYFNSNAVVIARLDHIRHVVPKNEQDYYLYRLVTTKILRGKVASVFTIWEENSSGRASFDWKRGASYLLFVDPRQDSKDFVIDGCGNSVPMPAVKTLDQIAALKGKKDTLIQAGVGGEADAWSGPPVTIVAQRADGKRFKAITNAEGRVQFRVPAGNYRVFPLPEKDFGVEMFSYDDPRHVVGVDGSCVQVQFEYKGKTPLK